VWIDDNNCTVEYVWIDDSNCTVQYLWIDDNNCAVQDVWIDDSRLADGVSSGWAVNSVGLRPLSCRNCGFDLHRRHGCLSVVNDVCSSVEVSATGRSFVQGTSTECMCVITCNNNLLHLKLLCRTDQAKKEMKKVYHACCTKTGLFV